MSATCDSLLCRLCVTISRLTDERTLSNWQLMLVEFLYNTEWQHLDVFNKLLQTIVMAFVGTLFAAILAFRRGGLSAAQCRWR